LELASRGAVEEIGSAPHFVARSPAGAVLAEQRWRDANLDFQSLLEAVIGWVETHHGADRLIAWAIAWFMDTVRSARET
jgi:acetate kinase